MKYIDCAVIGAGPAGLNASLVLGRARKQIALFDNKTNRNRATGRTSEKNIYLAGETMTQGPSSLIIAASHGNKAAIAINSDITDERF